MRVVAGRSYKRTTKTGEIVRRVDRISCGECWYTETRRTARRSGAQCPSLSVLKMEAWAEEDVTELEGRADGPQGS